VHAAQGNTGANYNRAYENPTSNEPTFPGLSLASKTQITTVRNLAEPDPSWMMFGIAGNGVSYNDIEQGGLGDCSLLV
jgi:hypothetical protein